MNRRRSKRSKESHDVEMDPIVEEPGDDVTIIADNSDTSHKFYDGAAYLQLRVEVEKSKKRNANHAN